MNRRKFLNWLAALPLVGWITPKERLPSVPTDLLSFAQPATDLLSFARPATDLLDDTLTYNLAFGLLDSPAKILRG